MFEVNSKRKKYLNKVAIQALNKIRECQENTKKLLIMQEARAETIRSEHEYTGKIYLCPDCQNLFSYLVVEKNWISCKKCFDLRD